MTFFISFSTVGHTAWVYPMSVLARHEKKGFVYKKKNCFSGGWTRCFTNNSHPFLIHLTNPTKSFVYTTPCLTERLKSSISSLGGLSLGVIEELFHFRGSPSVISRLCFTQFSGVRWLYRVNARWPMFENGPQVANSPTGRLGQLWEKTSVLIIRKVWKTNEVLKGWNDVSTKFSKWRFLNQHVQQANYLQFG